jgi:hypothetical protein
MGVFDDATVRNICGAFDLACKQLNDAGQPDVVHEVMIKRIIAAARRGERDVKLLQDAGLTGLRKPNILIPFLRARRAPIFPKSANSRRYLTDKHDSPNRV